VPHLKQAVAADPDSGYFQANLARAYGMIGKEAEKDKAYGKARELLHSSVDPMEALFVGMLSTEAIRLQDYQRKVDGLRQSPYLEYPLHVHLETFAHCNATCDFCPYTEMARKGTRMDMDLIDKVIKDLEDIPKDVEFQFSPFKVNEPFLDARLFDIIARINDRLPNADISITSNASPITDKILERLVEVKKLEDLWISANDHRPDEYERVMGIPFERTKKRFDNIHRWKEDGRFEAPVILSRVSDGSPADQGFADWVRETYPLFKLNLTRRGDWLSQVETDAFPIPDVGCIRWFDIVITATGEVAHCVMDGKSEHPLGNVRDTHVLEIYNSQPYRSLRETRANRLGGTPCGQCGFL